MIQNNNFSVLPWYKSIEDQNHRKSYAYGATYPLITPLNKLLPFQIMRETRNNTGFIASIYDIDGNVVANDIGQYLIEAGLKVIRFESMGYDVIVFPALFVLNLNLPEGRLYIHLSDGVEQWFSEIFTTVRDVRGFLKIEWWDIENFVFDAGQIVYENIGFKNILYLNTELGKPEYVFEEDGETRDGYFFAEKQISEKTYKCVALAPEYLCDVMRFIRMSDYVLITDKYERKYKCDTFLLTPKWETQGDIASIEIEFQTATVVKKIGRGVILANTGDFNNDFDEDFNNDTN